jgi:hypothetical protein
VLFVPNVFEMFKLWRISARLTGSFGGDTFQSRNLLTLAGNEEKNKRYITTQLEMY